MELLMSSLIYSWNVCYLFYLRITNVGGNSMADAAEANQSQNYAYFLNWSRDPSWQFPEKKFNCLLYVITGYKVNICMSWEVDVF